MRKKLKYIIGGLLSLITFNKCGLMNDNPIYKHKPAAIFEKPEFAEIAQAIRDDDPSKIEQLFQSNPNMDLNEKGEAEMNLLFWAAAHQHPRSLEKLLQLGADPNVTMNLEEGSTHLLAMLASGKNDESFELLLKYGANPDGETNGTPAIIKTVYARRFDRLKYLLNHGANIDAIDKQTDLSLIHFCAKLNLYEWVVFLIEEGADFNRKSRTGGSVAFQVQKRRGKLQEKAEDWRAKVEYMLIERGVVFPITPPWLEKETTKN